MNLKILAKIWCFSAISFIIFMITLTCLMVINNINIITDPIQTSIVLLYVIPLAILILGGSILLDKLKKRELKIS